MVSVRRWEQAGRWSCVGGNLYRQEEDGQGRWRGADKPSRLPPAYVGIRCAAWEDGKCTTCQTAENMQGLHTCDGTHASSCEAHWPSYDFTQDQSWCCDSWCYVNATTCTPELQAKYGISLGDSWTGAALKYSYDACADPWSAPQALEAVHYSPQTFSQVTLHVCGVACQHGAAGWC